jgi:hypothetical protein
MSVTKVIRYTTKPECADENERLVRNVFAELSNGSGEELRYAVFRLDDGVSFVHVAVLEGAENPSVHVGCLRRVPIRDPRAVRRGSRSRRRRCRRVIPVPAPVTTRPFLTAAGRRVGRLSASGYRRRRGSAPRRRWPILVIAVRAVAHEAVSGLGVDDGVGVGGFDALDLGRRM